VAEDQIIENGIRLLLQSLGEQTDREGLRDTPQRFVRAVQEMTSGLSQSPTGVLNRVFQSQCDELVIVRDIEFTSLCEHHLMPFFGTVTVGYLPAKGRIVGLSKIPRMVQVLAQRPQTQENMTRQIAESLQNHTLLKPLGCGVIVQAIHSCLRHRGARQPRAEMITSSMLGTFRSDPKVRSEFLTLAGSRSSLR
jgi:GTP cyclohydrolase I